MKQKLPNKLIGKFASNWARFFSDKASSPKRNSLMDPDSMSDNQAGNTRNSTSKKSNKVIGDQYEDVACQYLMAQGLYLLERNFHSRHGELDLIMRHNQTYIFVEVKYRKTNHYGNALEMVTEQKKRKLIKTAMIWMFKHNLSSEQVDFRFDVLAIERNGQQIDWIKNAITQG